MLSGLQHTHLFPTVRRRSGGLLRHLQKMTTAVAMEDAGSNANANSNANTNANSTLQRVYDQYVQAGELDFDPVQVRALQRADALLQRLAEYEGPDSVKPSWWETLQFFDADHHIPRGLYLHGGVGCGKTFVMDLFFEHVPIAKKQRVHLHEFMLDIHRQMHHLREEGNHEDPIPLIAKRLLANSWLLCFDEFQVSDVADALILRRLFSTLLDQGLVMVATSNLAPNQLYSHGLQRELFLPFIDLLSTRCDVVSLNDSHMDYRAQKGEHHARNVFLSPITPELTAAFDKEFADHCKGEPVVPTIVKADGREIVVPEAAINNRTCQFTFDDLCDHPHSAADYYAIAANFNTIFVRDIPKLNTAYYSALHRFITFIDCMYDEDRMVYCLAEQSPDELFALDSNCPIQAEEHVIIDRAISRLNEMQSEDYAERHADSTANAQRTRAQLAA